MRKISFKPGLPADELRELLTVEYGITDTGGLAILDAGLSMYARAEESRKVIDKDGLMIPTEKGGYQKHPLLATERDCRALWLSALRQLNFDIIPAHPAPGRPPGR